MAKSRKGTGSTRAGRSRAVARLIVVEADDFARAIDAVRAAKQGTPTQHERARLRTL
jgi:hypothetical protein